MYIITEIESSPRSILKSLNNGLQGGMNEIKISLRKEYKFLGIFPMIKRCTATGVLHPIHDINDYIKVGDVFDLSKYSMLSIK